MTSVRGLDFLADAARSGYTEFVTARRLKFVTETNMPWPDKSDRKRYQDAFRERFHSIFRQASEEEQARYLTPFANGASKSLTEISVLSSLQQIADELPPSTQELLKQLQVR